MELWKRIRRIERDGEDLYAFVSNSLDKQDDRHRCKLIDSGAYGEVYSLLLPLKPASCTPGRPVAIVKEENLSMAVTDKNGFHFEKDGKLKYISKRNKSIQKQIFDPAIIKIAGRHPVKRGITEWSFLNYDKMSRNWEGATPPVIDCRLLGVKSGKPDPSEGQLAQVMPRLTVVTQLFDYTDPWQGQKRKAVAICLTNLVADLNRLGCAHADVKVNNLAYRLELQDESIVPVFYAIDVDSIVSADVTVPSPDITTYGYGTALLKGDISSNYRNLNSVMWDFLGGDQLRRLSFNYCAAWTYVRMCMRNAPTVIFYTMKCMGEGENAPIFGNYRGHMGDLSFENIKILRKLYRKFIQNLIATDFIFYQGEEGGKMRALLDRVVQEYDAVPRRSPKRQKLSTFVSYVDRL